MTLADAWYETGNLLAIAGIAVSVIFGVLALWVTYRVAFPRNRILYGIPSVTSLVDTSAIAGGTLEILYQGQTLSDPKLIEVWLVNSGQKDIPSADFDNGAPIELELSTPILGVLDVLSGASTTPVPPMTVSGSRILVGPALLRKNHRLRYRILIDGPDPTLTCKCSITDIDISQKSTDNLDTLARGARFDWLGALSALLWLSILPIFLYTAWRLFGGGNPLRSSDWELLLPILITWLVTVTVLDWIRARMRRARSR
jgi:hypothetical protein